MQLLDRKKSSRYAKPLRFTNPCVIDATSVDKYGSHMIRLHVGGKKNFFMQPNRLDLSLMYVFIIRPRFI